MRQYILLEDYDINYNYLNIGEKELLFKIIKLKRGGRFLEVYDTNDTLLFSAPIYSGINKLEDFSLLEIKDTLLFLDVTNIITLFVVNKKEFL